MFAVEWLAHGSLVDKEISVSVEQSEVIARAKARAPDMAKRHPGREPDTFRLKDPAGNIVGVFPVGIW